MYKLLTALLLLPVLVIGQTHTSVDQGATLYRFKNGIKPDSALFLPRKDTATTDPTMLAPGMLVYRPLDSLLYWRKGNAMTPIASGVGSLGDYYTKSESDGRFVHYSDTTLMLSPYMRKIDTTAMLIPYLRKVDTSAMLLPYLKKIDTTSMLSSYVRSTRRINTTSPLSGGGNLSADRTLSIANAQADGENKGAATFRSDHFDDDGLGAISLDTINGPNWTKTQADARFQPIPTIDPLNRFTFSGWAVSYANIYNAAEGSVLTLNGDTLINIFRLDTARQHAGGKGQVVKRYSYDAGLTWTTPVVIFDSSDDDRNVVAGRLDNGRIVVLFNKYNGNNTSGTVTDRGRIYSDDKGATWSSFASISTTIVGNTAFFAPISRAGDGNYKVAIYAADRADIMSSSDGATWTTQATVFDYSADATKTPSETALSYIGGNRMIALSRDDGSPDSSYYQHISSDNGATWTYAGRTNMNNNLVNVNRTPPSLLYDAARNLVIATSTTRNATANGAPYLYRQDSMYLYISRPDSVFASPKKWLNKISMIRPMPAQFTPFYGYPTITKRNDGSYLGIITEMAPVSLADAIGGPGSYEYEYFYQFDINYISSYLDGNIDTSRYPGLIPVRNPVTGMLDCKSNTAAFANGLDSLSMFSLAKTLRVGTLANASTLDAFQIVDNNALRIFRATGDGRLVAGRPTGGGVNSISLSDGINILNETRWFNASTGAENMRLTNSGSLYLGTTSGSDRLNVNGNGNLTGNFNITANLIFGGQLQGTTFNSNGSAFTLKTYGGSSGGLRGGGIDFIGGSAAANPGTLAFRTGTGGGGTDQPVNMRLDALGKLSVGGDVPVSTLDVRGSFGAATLTTGSATALTASYNTLILTATAASITLPAASSSTNREYNLVNYNTGGNISISSSGGSLLRDGSTVSVLPNNAKWTFRSDGTNWYVIKD